MKPTTFTIGRFLPVAIIICAAVILVSFDFKQTPSQSEKKTAVADTIPRERKVRDLDEAIAELDRVDIDAEMKKAMAEVSRSLKQVDAAKIQMEVDKALREIDMEKMKKEISVALKEIDTEKMKKEVSEAISSIDMNKIRQEIEHAMKDVELEKIKVDIDMKNLQKEMEKIGPEIKKSLEDAKVEIAKAKEELREYKSFVDGLEKEGLINKKEDYSIVHEDGQLIINGKVAPAETYKKNSNFLKKHPKFNLRKEADDFDMDLD